MTPKQLKEVVNNHKRYFDIDSRTNVTYICQFVEDLLREELEYTKETEPQAIVSIRELEIAIRTVMSLWCDIEDMDTDELIKEHIWD
jgi:ubiquitin C-terminal hydrolase